MAASISIAQILAQFSSLQEAFIDTSSILYMEKCGFLTLLSEVITLRIVPGVCLEYGPGSLPCAVYTSPEPTAGSTDTAIYAACLETGLPLVSDDKGLLKRIARTGLPYYNSLMMLNFLFYKQAIPGVEFTLYCCRLGKIARYGSAIWNSGFEVTQGIIEHHRRVDPLPTAAATKPEQ